MDGLIKVRILACEKYANRFEGKCGVIESTSCGNTTFGIRIDGHTNPRSAAGLFWYDEDEFTYIESEETVMFDETEKFTAAGVKFLEGSNRDKEYFYALFDDYCVGDIVVVQTGHHGLALAEISSIDSDGKDKVLCSREIVTRVDMSQFQCRNEKRKALAKLKKDMAERVKELQAVAIYEMLAEKDAALATMLAEYKTLTVGR